MRGGNRLLTASKVRLFEQATAELRSPRCFPFLFDRPDRRCAFHRDEFTAPGATATVHADLLGEFMDCSRGSGGSFFSRADYRPSPER